MRGRLSALLVLLLAGSLSLHAQDFDFTTGTYKQVMVQWEDFQKSMATSFGSSSQQYAPIPADPLRPAYWNSP